MRVLAAYPALDVSANEMGAVWSFIARERGVETTILASTDDVLKGTRALIRAEEHPRLRVLRTDRGGWGRKRLAELAREVRPDVIFCAVISNLPTALQIRRHHSAPIVLHTEFFEQGLGLIQRRHYLGIKLLRPIAAARRRRLVLQNCATVLCSNPAEFRGAGQCFSSRLLYLPWPHLPVPDTFRESNRSPHRSVFVGSLSQRKGADTLSRYLSGLLSVDPDTRLTVVGPALDASGRSALERLQTCGGDRVQIEPTCSRERALRLISSAGFVLSPGERLGWGLIGDSWSCETPIIAAHAHYDLADGVNCLVAEDDKRFLGSVAELRSQPRLRERLIAGGASTVATHSVDRVANTLYAALEAAAAAR